MGRLTASLWEKARAEYEVKGVSLGEISRVYEVDIAAVSRRAKKEGWIKGKNQDLVERKVAAVKEIMAVKKESQGLPLTFQHTIDSVAKERLQAEGIFAEVDVALGMKCLEIIKSVSSPEGLELVARARKHLAPQTPKTETKISLTQQQGVAVAPLSPAEALKAIVKRQADDSASDS